jgi:hypothetical protein
VDQENVKGRTHSVAQAWRADRISQFPQGADTKSVALFTEIAVEIDSKGEIVKLEWLGCIVEKDNIRTQVWWRNIYYNTPYPFAQRIPRALMMTDSSEHGGVLFCGSKKRFI